MQTHKGETVGLLNIDHHVTSITGHVQVCDRDVHAEGGDDGALAQVPYSHAAVP